jgi:hypothetical protein
MTDKPVMTRPARSMPILTEAVWRVVPTTATQPRSCIVRLWPNLSTVKRVLNAPTASPAMYMATIDPLIYFSRLLSSTMASGAEKATDIGSRAVKINFEALLSDRSADDPLTVQIR